MADIKKNEELEDNKVNTEENTDKVSDKIEENVTEEVKVEEKVDEHKDMKEQLKAEIRNELKEELNSTKKEENVEKNGEVVSTGVMGTLAISFVNLVTVNAMAFVLYLLTKVILSVLGYDIKDTFGIYLVVYVIANLLYTPVLKLLKMEQTVGEKVLNIK